MKNVILFSLVMMLMSINVNAQEKITVVTEELPPFQIQLKNGSIGGMSTEIVQALIDEVGVDATIKIYPWARAYQTALKKKNVLIYSIMRNKEREKLFKWVGSIIPLKIYLYKLKKRNDIVINNINDAKKYKIGLVIGDVRAQYFKKLGGFNIDLVSDDVLNIIKLLKNRIDIIADGEIILAYRFKTNKRLWESGYKYSDIEKVLYLPELSLELYLAFSKLTSDELVGRFIKALEKLKAEGKYDKIINKYVK